MRFIPLRRFGAALRGAAREARLRAAEATTILSEGLRLRAAELWAEHPGVVVGDACVLDPVDRLDLVPAVGGGSRPAEHLSQLLTAAVTAAAQHPAIVDAESGQVIGTVTSGTFSPTLHTGIGMALVDASHGAGELVGVQVRRRVEQFDLIKPPFVAPRLR